MMKIKILSDGTPIGTRVVHAETGEPVEGVYSVEWSHTAPGDVVCATLKFFHLPAEVVADMGDEVEITAHGDQYRVYQRATRKEQDEPAE